MVASLARAVGQWHRHGRHRWLQTSSTSRVVFLGCHLAALNGSFDDDADDDDADDEYDNVHADVVFARPARARLLAGRRQKLTTGQKKRKTLISIVFHMVRH